jgi:hypothetical protein
MIENKKDLKKFSYWAILVSLKNSYAQRAWIVRGHRNLSIDNVDKALKLTKDYIIIPRILWGDGLIQAFLSDKLLVYQYEDLIDLDQKSLLKIFCNPNNKEYKSPYIYFDYEERKNLLKKLDEALSEEDLSFEDANIETNKRRAAEAIHAQRIREEDEDVEWGEPSFEDGS